MLTNKVMITLSGIICIGFIFCGILDILHYMFMQIILASLFLFFIGALFYVNLKPTKKESFSKNKSSN